MVSQRTLALVLLALALAGRGDAAPCGPPVLVRDVNTAFAGIDPRGFAWLGPRIVFSAHHRDVGRELWVSDGTAPGTRLLADLLPGPSGSDPNLVGATGTHAFYSVASGAVWATDGTAAGTAVVRPSWSYWPTTSFGGHLYFRNQDTPSSPCELWRSDGTPAGTSFVAGICPERYLSLGDVLYLGASDAARGSELYRTDGTAAGTVRLTDSCPGTCPGVSSGPVAMGARILFGGDDGSGSALRAYDPATGLEEVVLSGAGAGDLVADGTRAFFSGYQERTGWELWRSDGTAAGTIVLRVGLGASTPPRGFEFSAGKLFFLVGRWPEAEVWVSDGTPAGTIRLRPSFGDSGVHVRDAGGYVLFRSDTPGLGTELWRSDGTPSGTYPVTTGLLVPAATDLVVLGDRLFFPAEDFTHGRELFSLCVTIERSLLRNVDARPPSPGAASFLPLVASRDRYVDDFPSGGLDPEPIVADATRPLVFYALDEEEATIRLAKTPGLDLRIEY